MRMQGAKMKLQTEIRGKSTESQSRYSQACPESYGMRIKGNIRQTDRKLALKEK